MKSRTLYIPQRYNYAERTGNLKAEAVGVVKGEHLMNLLESDYFKRRSELSLRKHCIALTLFEKYFRYDTLNKTLHRQSQTDMLR